MAILFPRVGWAADIYSNLRFNSTNIHVRRQKWSNSCSLYTSSKYTCVGFEPKSSSRNFSIWSSLVVTPPEEEVSISSEKKVYDVVLKQAALVKRKSMSSAVLNVWPDLLLPGMLPVLKEAYDRSGEVCKEHAKTFYLVWCRRTDELVDGPNASHITPSALDEWESRLDDVFAGRPYDMFDAALSDTVAKFPVNIQNYPFTRTAKTLRKTQLREEMVILEEMEVEEGEIRESSSSSEQLDATTRQHVVTLSNAGLIQSLRDDRWQCIIFGILRGLLMKLESGNMENPYETFRSHERIGTRSILEFGGDPSYWTAFCATMAKGFQELTVMCQPIPYDTTRHENIVKWEAELEKWKQLEQRDLDFQHRFTEIRVNRDNLLLQLWKAPAITIDGNGGLVQQIRQQDDAMANIRNEVNLLDAMKIEASAECNRLRILVAQYDPGRTQREVNANATYRHICFTVKSLLNKLGV